MTLGQKIRTARIERSLTQKQLVGDQITRNMLSKIENDSATPSVRTLEYLASRLGLPAGYFLAELQDAPDVIPDGLADMRQAYRQGRYKDCMKLLEEHREACATDEGFLLLTKSAVAAANQALAEHDYEQAKQYADDADYYNKQGIYYSAQIDAEMGLILAECALALDISEFEYNSDEYLRAIKELSYAQRYDLACTEYMLRTGEDELAAHRLTQINDPALTSSSRYLYLKGECDLRSGKHREAVDALLQAEELCGSDKRLLHLVYASLAIAYDRLEDYKQAYKYASLQLKGRE